MIAASALRRVALLALALVCGVAADARAQTTPQMNIYGTVSTGLSNFPENGDAVQVVYAGTGTVVPTCNSSAGQVGACTTPLNADFSYSFPINDPTGTLENQPLTMLLVRNCTSYVLDCASDTQQNCQSAASGAQQTNFVYVGQSVNIGSLTAPTSTQLDWTVGAVFSSNACNTGSGGTGGTGTGSTGTSSTASGAGCPASLPGCDVAGVGVFDERAITAEKQCLLEKTPGPNCFTNGTGRVTSEDLLILLRALMQWQQQQAISAGQLPTAASSATSGTTQ